MLFALVCFVAIEVTSHAARRIWLRNIFSTA